MELGVSHVQNLSSSTPIVDNIFDKYNKNLVPIRSLSDHDSYNIFAILLKIYVLLCKLGQGICFDMLVEYVEKFISILICILTIC